MEKLGVYLGRKQMDISIREWNQERSNSFCERGRTKTHPLR
jgi:hypothetical protein